MHRAAAGGRAGAGRVGTDALAGVVPPSPVVVIEISGQVVRVNGEPVAHDGTADLHLVAVHETAVRVAQVLGRPVRAIGLDEHARTAFVVHPDGTASDLVVLEEFTAADHSDPAGVIAPAPAAPSAPPAVSQGRLRLRKPTGRRRSVPRVYVLTGLGASAVVAVGLIAAVAIEHDSETHPRTVAAPASTPTPLPSTPPASAPASAPATPPASPVAAPTPLPEVSLRARATAKPGGPVVFRVGVSRGHARARGAAVSGAHGTRVSVTLTTLDGDRIAARTVRLDGQGTARTVLRVPGPGVYRWQVTAEAAQPARGRVTVAGRPAPATPPSSEGSSSSSGSGSSGSSSGSGSAGGGSSSGGGGNSYVDPHVPTPVRPPHHHEPIPIKRH